MNVAVWAGEGEEAGGRVKLQKGCRKRICRAETNGGNAPAPLDQSKLPRYSVSVWAWTSSPVWMDLCALAVLASPGWCSASRALFTLPYLGVCYCNQPWKALGCRVGPGPPHSSLSKQPNGNPSKQSKQPLVWPRLLGMSRKSVKANI